MITYSEKVRTLKRAGHVIRAKKNIYGFYVFEYDGFKFDGRDKEDQKLAREMINLDFDLLMIEEGTYDDRDN